MQTYFEWAREKLSISLNSGIDFLAHDNEERGLFATNDISANSSIAKVPFRSLLTIFSAETVEPLKGLVSNPTIQEDDLLVLVLLYHRHLQDRSPWYKHIELLPKEYHSIANYSEGELEKIRGSNLHIIALRWKQQIREDFEKLLSIVDSCLPRNLIDKIGLTFESYLWGLSCIWSRFISIRYKDDRMIRAMVPVIDLLNHSNDGKLGHFYRIEDDTFNVFTTGNLLASEEIYLNYGNVPNSRLLMLYGFTLPVNPHDHVAIYVSATTKPLNETPEEKVLSRLRDKILQQHGVHLKDEAPFIFSLSLGVIPKNLLVFLRLRLIDNGELRSKCSWIMENIGTFLSKENELHAYECLNEILSQMFNAYHRSFEEDREELKSLDLLDVTNERGELKSKFIAPKLRDIHCLILNYSEKRILQHALTTVSEKISELKNS